MSTNINLGKQQITIFPYQEVTSVNANQILYEILQPGVSNTRIELYAPISQSQIGIRIFAGSTFVFPQSIIEAGQERKFLIKCVLESDVEIESFTKAQYWGSTYATSHQLYLYADLNYSLSNAENKYASFSLASSKEIIENEDNLIIATLLNHQYFVKQYNGGSGNLNPDLSYYYISYENQKNKDVFPELYKETTAFTPMLDTSTVNKELQQVRIEGGDVLSGNTFIRVPTTTLEIPGKASLPQGKLATDVYQVDVLRFKVAKDVSRTSGFFWESTIIDKPTPPEQWVWSASYSWTQDKLAEYLSGKILDLQDTGHIVLILVRYYGAIVVTDFVNQYPLWATEGFNRIIPSLCYIPKKSVLKLDEQDYHSRFKLPTYETTDLA